MEKFSLYHGSQYNGSTLWNKCPISIKQMEGHCISLELCMQSVKCVSSKLECCNTLYMWLIRRTQPHLFLIMKCVGSTLVTITEFLLISEPESELFCFKWLLPFAQQSINTSPKHFKNVSLHIPSLNHLQFWCPPWPECGLRVWLLFKAWCTATGALKSLWEVSLVGEP